MSNYNRLQYKFNKPIYRENTNEHVFVRRHNK